MALSLEDATDQMLLRQGDNAAYEELVRRHGKHVFNVCLRGLKQPQDAEDVAQAVFLALSQNAKSINDVSVAGWLHRVAWRLTLNARKAALIRRTREREAGIMKGRSQTETSDWAAVEPLLDGELDALPSKYRLPILLHIIEGESIANGAKRLGWNVGTFASRLGRGKELLRNRLVRRGVTLSVSLLIGLIGNNGTAAELPVNFSATTTQAASLLSKGADVSQLVLPRTMIMAHKTWRRMIFMTKLKTVAAIFLICSFFCAATGVITYKVVTSRASERMIAERDAQQLLTQLPAPNMTGIAVTCGQDARAPKPVPNMTEIAPQDAPPVQPDQPSTWENNPVERVIKALTEETTPVALQIDEVKTRSATKDALNNLVEEIAPLYGLIRPPFDLAYHDLNLKIEKDRISQACERQTRLETAWRDLQKSTVEASLDARQQSQMALLSYAFGTGALDVATSLSRAAGSGERLRLARVLLAECYFNEAVAELLELTKGEGKEAEMAQALLIQHALERRAISSQDNLLPLQMDLDNYLMECKKSARWAVLTEKIEKVVSDKVLPIGTSAKSSGPMDIVVPADILVSEEMGFGWENLFPFSFDRIFLETKSKDLWFCPPGHSGRSQGYVQDTSADFKLHTAYHGPLTFQLYYFEKEADWKTFTATALAKLAPEKKWEQTFHPLRANNRLAAIEQITVRDLHSGYYLLLAEARYAPFVAAMKFAVSHVAMYLRATRNQAFVAVVDRATGCPVADLPLELLVDSEPTLPSPPSELITQEEEEAFRQGFQGGAMPTISGANFPQSCLAQMRAFAVGQALRKRLPPNIAQKFIGKSGADGCWVQPLDLGQREFTYNLTARATAVSPAEARISYKEYPEPEEIKTLAWAGQPVYRPGAEAQFKGIIRRFNRLQASPYTRLKQEAVQVVVKNTNGMLWQGRCELSPAGAFHGAFAIPTDVKLGDYEIHVDGYQADPHKIFSVEEFRLPTFKINATMDQYNYAGGQMASGTVQVSYFTGKPVANVSVEVALETGELNPFTTTVYANNEGVATFRLPVPAFAETRHLTVRATALDASGQSYTCDTSFSAQPTSFYVTAECIPEKLVAGEMIELVVTAKTWAGIPVPGAQITVKEHPVVAKTGPDGKTSLKIKTQNHGYDHRQEFNICTVVGKEAFWHRHSVQLLAKKQNAVATKQAPSVSAHRNYLSLHLKETYLDASNPLRVTLETDNASGRNCCVLLFADNFRSLAYRALYLPVGKHEIEIPTNLDFTPQTHLQAVMLTGGEILNEKVTVYIRPVQRFLRIEVATDKPQYRPAERCVAEILALDHAGRPVPNAEISLGVVQTPIYEIHEDSTPDLQAYFYSYTLPCYAQAQYDYNGPSLYATLQFCKGPKYRWGYLVDTGSGRGSFGSRSGGGRSLMVKRHGGSRATTMEMRLREDFKTTAYWVADLVTDVNGKARAEFTFPDDITEWRFTARSLTAETLVGEVRANRQTLLPLQAELILPRALRKGDRVRVAAVIHENANQARAVTAQGACVGGITVEKEFALKPRDSVRLEIPVAPTSTGELQLTTQVRDLANGDTDASARVLQALPRGHRATANYAGMVKDGGVVSLDFGALAQPDTHKVTITLETGFAGVISSAVSNLIEYPYGCVEQTMSRFMPTAIAGRALKQMQLPNPHETKLKDVFAKSLNRIASFQHPDGGWGWWQTDKSNDFMTAYVLEGLTLCAAAGQDIPKGMLSRAENYLAEKVCNNALWNQRQVSSIGEVDITIYVAHSLALFYAQDTKLYTEKIAQLVRSLDEQDAVTKIAGKTRETILLADTLRLLGKKDEAVKLFQEATLRFEFPKNDRRAMLTAASLLEVGRVLEPQNPTWLKVARELVAARNGYGWIDTQVSAAAVRSLSAFIESAPAMNGRLRLLMDGKPVGTLTPKPNETTSLTLQSEIIGGKVITLQREGNLSDYFWSARVEGFLTQPPAPTAQPKVSLICRVFEGEKEIVKNNIGAIAIKPGVTYKVRLECELAEAMSWLRISFPRPCGVELVSASKLKEQNMVAIEERDDATHFFVDSWEKGSRAIEFFVRAEVEGEAFAPQPEFEPMYGNAVSVRINAPVLWQIGK